jgi:hypothetical protein
LGIYERKAFLKETAWLMGLKGRVIQLYWQFTEDTCHCVVANIHICLLEVVWQNGNHTEHVLC